MKKEKKNTNIQITTIHYTNQIKGNRLIVYKNGEYYYDIECKLPARNNKESK